MSGLRVIAGEFRSRRLKTPRGTDVRPTSDRLREALFNVLAASIADTVFIDAYAGSGAVGIEALSRGARRSVFIERSRTAAAVIRENLASLGIRNRAEIVVEKAAAALPRFDADIAFLDPPYAHEGEYEQTLSALGRLRVPLVIAQHPTRMKLLDTYGRLQRSRTLTQGDNTLSFYAVGFQTNLPDRSM
jgi:16S rRNA (guanine966-N2)-methyltransferase